MDKVETRLQHPTPYHMLQNQKRQVREYLSNSGEPSPTEPAQIMSPPSNQTSTTSEATEWTLARLEGTLSVWLGVGHLKYLLK
ncbi:hypothetical protein FJT64_022806 [Amphibalanus amphitrite]|uniref:MiT/TFE transcription factors N-terminal domain-containing protein n=1 Tax=Amphibalanus amphitrite TaxID=1232801 RepID=A0A6A4WCY2_AMPAM|nr:hypothetical protein FJT64_022806 [Amphibalanus amphitrite]